MAAGQINLLAIRNGRGIRLVLAFGLWFFMACESTDQYRLRQYNEDGVHLFQQGDFQAAQESFALALEMKPQDPALLYNLGQCHDRLRDFGRAEQYYYQCLQRQPDHGDCRHALAVLQCRTGRKEQAQRMIEDWLRHKPDLADAYALDGWKLRQENALPQAQGRLQQALGIDPHNVRANIELGIVYEQMGMPERAVVLYERALAKNPKQPEVIARRSALLAKKVGRPLP